MTIALKSISLWLYFILIVLATLNSGLFFWTLEQPWMLVMDIMANLVILASVALFAVGARVEHWRGAVGLALLAQACILYFDGPPESVVDGLFVLFLVVPSSIIGWHVGG